MLVIHLEQWESHNIASTRITIHIITYIRIRFNDICLKQCHKRVNAVSFGPLGYGPRIFLQQVWDMMSQNIASADSPGRSWFWPRVSIWYNSLLNVNIVPKYSGSDLFTNLYQDFIYWTSNIFVTFSISSSLNNGSVWALYLLFVIMRRARFCSLNILFHSRPQHVIPNCRWDKIKKSYVSFMAENGRYLFSLFIIPSVREILLAIFEECELQFINSFMVKPRKLKHETRSIFLSLICRSGISSFAITLW